MLTGVGHTYAQTTSDKDQSRQVGYGIGGSGWGTEYELDANGNVKRDANGNPIKKEKSGSLDGALKILNSTTGVTAVTTTGSPAKGAGGSASFAVDSGTDFRCDSSLTAENFKKLVIQGVRIKVNACKLDAAGNGTVSISTCYKGVSAAHTCPKTADYGSEISLAANGGFTSDGKLNYGVGCNSNNMCRLTGRGSLSVGATEAELNNAQSRESDLKDDLADTAAKNDLAGKTTAYAQSFQECTGKNMADGTFSTCDKSYTVGIDLTKSGSTSTPGGSTCTSERTCLQEAVENQSSQKICYREFQNSVHQKNLEYPTKTCKLTYSLDIPGLGENYYYNTWYIRWMCSLNPEMCKRQPGGVQNQPDQVWMNTPLIPEDSELTNECNLPSSLKISADQGSWECGSGYNSENQICDRPQYVRNATYYDAENPKLISETYEPAPDGPCNSQVEKASEYFTCTGSWIGRKLPDDQCTAGLNELYSGATGTVSVDEFQKAGCGYCTAKQYNSVCSTGVSQSTCENGDLNSCTLTSKKPLTYSGGTTGVLESQEEVYNCTTQKKTCVSWSHAAGSSYCITSDIAQGTDKMPATNNSPDNGWAKVAMASEMMDQVSSSAKNSNSPEILLFGGSSMSCEKPVGIGVLGQKNCCKPTIQRPSANVLTQDGCTEDEAKLAAARRKLTTHFVWTETIKKGFIIKIPVKKIEHYCVFDGVLARVIQEQGRMQLSTLVSGGATNRQTSTYNFPYYAANDNGGWNTPVTLNGVQVTAWSWPALCKDDAKAAQQAINNGTGPQCSGALAVWFATCVAANGCEALPVRPEDGSKDWNLAKVNPLALSLEATSKFTTVKGACNTATASCSYSVTAVPLGVGGSLLAQQELAWQLFSNIGDTTSQGLTLSEYMAACAKQYGSNACSSSQFDKYKNPAATVGDILIKPETIGGSTGSAIPATVPLSLSVDNGKTWSTLQVSSNGQDVDYNQNGKSFTVHVSCTQSTGMCIGKVYVQVKINTKPWEGSDQGMDCSGFTLSQFGALDFDKMDLSEWTTTLNIKETGTQSKTEMTQMAVNQAAGFNSAFNGGQGTVSNTKESADSFVSISKKSGFGPFDVKVSVPTYWPNASAPESQRDVVVGVTVNWGDCTGVKNVGTPNGGGFVDTHRYVDPKQIWSQCGKGGLEQNYTANVEVKVNLRNNGTKVYTFQVTNYWADSPSSGKGATSAENSNNTAPARDSRLPVVVDPLKPGGGG